MGGHRPKCGEGRWAYRDEKKRRVSKASFQNKKQEGYCQWRNFQIDLMLFYFAVAFHKLGVWGQT